MCERVFLPPKQELASLREAGTRLVSLESQTPIGDFDVIAFPYRSMGLHQRPHDAAAGWRAVAPRSATIHPLIVIGGAVTFVNRTAAPLPT